MVLVSSATPSLVSAIRLVVPTLVVVFVLLLSIILVFDAFITFFASLVLLTSRS